MSGFSIHVSLETRASISNGVDVETLIHDFEAKILDDSLMFDEELDPRRVAGSVEFYVVKLDLALNSGISALDACDSVSQDVFEYGEAVLDPSSGQLKDKIAARFELFGGDLLILHCFKIEPAYRGRNLGLLAANRLIDLFGNGLVVGRPQPLQHVPSGDSRRSKQSDTTMKYELFRKPKAQAKKSLERHWCRLGFERIGRTDFWALSSHDKRVEIEVL